MGGPDERSSTRARSWFKDPTSAWPLARWRRMRRDDAATITDHAIGTDVLERMLAVNKDDCRPTERWWWNALRRARAL